MLVTKTRAAVLAGVARRTFYYHITDKRISVTKGDDGSELVDVAELERVYGKELISHNLLKLTQSDDPNNVQSRASAQNAAHDRGDHEVLLLREKIRGQEEIREHLEAHQRREREALQEEVASLREALRRSQEQTSQLTRLLTDQSGEQAGRGAEQERKLQNLDDTVLALRKANHRILKHLKAERARPWWQRLGRS